MNRSMNRSARARDRCDSFDDGSIISRSVFRSIRSRNALDAFARRRFARSFHFISFHFISFHSFHSFVQYTKQNETETKRNGVDIDVNGDLITRSFI
tara:strand:+ start:1088 stop:1378 length:291 start_codon:yes stop_codon:yes gene_type:complete